MMKISRLQILKEIQIAHERTTDTQDVIGSGLKRILLVLSIQSAHMLRESTHSTVYRYATHISHFDEHTVPQGLLPSRGEIKAS